MPVAEKKRCDSGTRSAHGRMQHWGDYSHSLSDHLIWSKTGIQIKTCSEGYDRFLVEALVRSHQMMEANIKIYAYISNC